ncbi:Nse4 C-terminal-domain containing protein [Nitzschia inconspicua]|uniref:Non-structural maintenance of chromosomes element 4 n=1 Tax=Nitzschia inconspicua TaxID=303405 RepID=A0A9K3PS37_9STRA|nr:Nse4 C-terminal-domain containing protein [Nitzschia inconspicua]KAG7357604.1 Nse4 C-terminal-domain containing protein [Nitzschia inconspicua]
MSDFENDDDYQVLEDQSNNNNFQVCRGQTDEERREIRRQQRLLHRDIEERGDDLEVSEVRHRNNKIFSKVRFVREAVLDGENVNLIATKAAQKVDQLVQVPRYDADRVVSRLIQQCRYIAGGTAIFDWKKLGIEAGVCFNAIPSNVTFLNGPLQNGQDEFQVKQRAARVPRERVEEEVKEERPENVEGHTARGADQLSAVQKNITDVAEALTRKVNKGYRKNKAKLIELYGSESEVPGKVRKKLKRNPGVCGVELLFNPKSFTQTVENIFHYSFLVRKGEAGLSIKDEQHIADGMTLPAGPSVVYYNSEHGQKALPPPTQAIVSLTMKDWREMIRAYNVKKSDVPHRTGSKFQHETSATGPAQHDYQHSDEGSVDEVEEEEN